MTDIGRRDRGLEIVQQDAITQISPSVFVAKGSQQGKTYRIISYPANASHPEGYWTCECWDWKARGRKAGIPCKHITAAKVFSAINGKW